jgi:hypothetical protein
MYNIILRPTQFEWVGLELIWASYGVYKFQDILHCTRPQVIFVQDQGHFNKTARPISQDSTRAIHLRILGPD